MSFVIYSRFVKNYVKVLMSDMKGKTNIFARGPDLVHEPLSAYHCFMV